MAIEILKKLELRQNIDFAYESEGIIRLYSHLELRDTFNKLFVNAGIDVRKVNLCEENLEDFFTRFLSNN